MENAQELNQLKQLIVDEYHLCWNTENMKERYFRTQKEAVRYQALSIANDAPDHIKEDRLLEQQISEIIKNAIYHGNQLDYNKLVRTFVSFKNNTVKLIVEDEGSGFKNLDLWNSFYKKRAEAIERADIEIILKYSIFINNDPSDFTDGGNSLFAAVEYWNDGIIYNERKNKICCIRKF